MLAPGADSRPASIQVIAIRRLDGKSTVKAFCDIQVGGLKILGAKIVQQPGQRAWLAMPSVKASHGWTNTLEITSRDLRDRMTEVVLEAFEARP